MGCCSDDPAGSRGYNRDRGCTDILFLGVFVALWVGMVIVCVIAVKDGAFYRLTHGRDSMARACGLSNDAPTSAERRSDAYSAAQGTTWEARTKIWFPLTINLTDPLAALKLGVCVSQCPSIQRNFSVTDRSTWTYLKPYYRSLGDDWLVVYNSTSDWGWCIPDTSFLNHPPAGLGEVIGGLKRLGPLTAIASYIFRGYAEVISSWRVIAISAAIAVGLCFVWLLLLRLFVKPLVYLSMLAVLAILIGAGWVAYRYGNNLTDDTTSRTNADGRQWGSWYRGLGIVIWVIALVYLLVLVFLFRRIQLATQVIAHAASVLGTTPTLPIVPVVTIALVVALTAWFMCVGGLLQTMSDKTVQQVYIPSTGTNTTAVVTSGQNRRTILQLYNVFGYLWSCGFVNAIGYTTISVVASLWYFSVPGDSKSTPPGVVVYAFGVVLRYHLGTMALGSFIVAIVQFFRFLLRQLEERLRAGGCAVKFLLCCADCCLACIERILKYISRNAFIVTGFKGSNFCAAAVKAMGLLVKNALRVGTVTFIGDAVIFFGKLLIAFAVTFIAYGLITHTSLCKDCSTGLLALLLVLFISYIIASLFLGVLGTVVDTLLICVCYDDEENNGRDRPYFFTSELAAITGHGNEDNAGVDHGYKTDTNDKDPYNPPAAQPDGGG